MNDFIFDALVQIAEKHTADIMPGYTHMQHAQLKVTLSDGKQFADA